MSAEGFTLPPPDEISSRTPENTEPSLETPIKRIIKRSFLEFLRPKNPEDDDEDDEKSKNPKQGRLRRLFGMVFPLTVDKREVSDSSHAVADKHTLATPTTEVVSLDHDRSKVQSDVTSEAGPKTDSDTEATGSALDSVSAAIEHEPAESETVDASAEAEELETGILRIDHEPTSSITDSALEVPATESANEVEPASEEAVTSRSLETVYLGGLTRAERRRLHRAEDRSYELAREQRATAEELEKLKKQLKDARKTPSNTIPKTAVSPMDSLKAPEPTEVKQASKLEITKPAKKEKESVKAENLAKLKLTEAQAEVVAKAAPEEFRREKRAEAANKHTAEKLAKTIGLEVEPTDTEQVKEIARELSHERKDLDKKSSFLVPSAITDARRSKQLAASRVLVAADDDSAVKASVASAAANSDKSNKQLQKPVSSLYQQAIYSGFVTAVIIIAVILLIILLQ